jgi:hypothetical protein
MVSYPNQITGPVTVTGDLTVTGNESVAGTENITGEVVSHTQLTMLNAGQPSTPAAGTKLWSLGNEAMALGADGVPVPLMSEPYHSAPPGGALAETVPRLAMNSAAVAIGSTAGTVYMAAVWLPIGTVITNVTFITGTTAANTPTHWWAGVSTFDGTQRAHSADQLTAAIGANSKITVAMAAPYTAPATGTYYFLLSVTATANPTLTGVGAVTNSSKTVPVLAGVSASAAQPAPGVDGTTVYTAPTGDNAIGYFNAS